MAASQDKAPPRASRGSRPSTTPQLENQVEVSFCTWREILPFAFGFRSPLNSN